MPVGKILYFLSIRERKNFQYEGNGTCKRSAAVAKELTNYENLALSKTKKKTEVASGLF